VSNITETKATAVRFSPVYGIVGFFFFLSFFLSSSSSSSSSSFCDEKTIQF
jgi:hypothetical protein